MSPFPSPGQPPTSLHVQPEVYPRTSPLPSPGLLAAPQPSFLDAGAQAGGTNISSTNTSSGLTGAVARHTSTHEPSSFFEASLPHGRAGPSHGAGAPPARR